MIYLGGVMGLRFGEAAALRLSDIDFDQGRVLISRSLSEVDGRIEVGTPKTSAGIRALATPLPLMRELRDHVHRLAITDPDALLFADSFGGPIRRSNFRRRVFEPAVEQAGLPGLTFHGLRHSAATTWMADGIDARTVQRLLGHSDPRLVLKLYAHAADEALRAAAKRTGATFWGDPGKRDEA
jgi:integrase